MNTIIGMVLVLGVIILVHEWGHFIAARFFGVRVDVFSVGFGPRLFGMKRGATDWRVSALPLSGTRTLVAPCSACYLNLAKADHYMNEQPKLGQRVNEALAAGGDFVRGTGGEFGFPDRAAGRVLRDRGGAVRGI